MYLFWRQGKASMPVLSKDQIQVQAGPYKYWPLNRATLPNVATDFAATAINAFTSPPYQKPPF